MAQHDIFMIDKTKPYEDSEDFYMLKIGQHTHPDLFRTYEDALVEAIAMKLKLQDVINHIMSQPL